MLFLDRTIEAWSLLGKSQRLVIRYEWAEFSSKVSRYIQVWRDRYLSFLPSMLLPLRWTNYLYELLRKLFKAYGAEGRRHLPYKNGSFFDNADDDDDKVSTKYFNTIKVNHLII